MGKMNVYSVRDFKRIMEQNGWHGKQGGTSHITYKKEGMRNIVTIPLHNKDICLPMAKRLLKEAGITIN